MTKWEYLSVTEDITIPVEFDVWLNRYGKDGWELVSVVTYDDHKKAYLKRPLRATSKKTLALPERL